MSDRIDAVLFDLGGVLVRLGGGVATVGAWLGLTDEREILRHWLASPWVRQFECGMCSAEDFGENMVRHYGLSVAPAAFLDAFRQWPEGLFDGAADLVRSIRSDLVAACLTNTNALHWMEQKDCDTIRSLFKATFASHEIGMVKPDAEVFQHVADALRIEPGNILFLDDTEPNVAGARAAGFDAHCVRGVGEARAVLSSHGLLQS